MKKYFLLVILFAFVSITISGCFSRPYYAYDDGPRYRESYVCDADCRSERRWRSQQRKARQREYLRYKRARSQARRYRR